MASQFRPFTQKLVDILTIIILFLNGSTETAIVMDNCKGFKHSAELREYRRLEKRKQRAQATKKEHITNG
jgi:hypothetical protein